MPPTAITSLSVARLASGVASKARASSLLAVEVFVMW
jgi:hypothetical protein